MPKTFFALCTNLVYDIRSGYQKLTSSLVTVLKPTYSILKMHNRNKHYVLVPVVFAWNWNKFFWHQYQKAFSTKYVKNNFFYIKSIPYSYESACPSSHIRNQRYPIICKSSLGIETFLYYLLLIPETFSAKLNVDGFQIIIKYTQSRKYFPKSKKPVVSPPGKVSVCKSQFECLYAKDDIMSPNSWQIKFCTRVVDPRPLFTEQILREYGSVVNPEHRNWSICSIFRNN